MNLVDKYRPRTLDQVVGQDRVIREIRTVLGAPDFTGGAFWIEGPTGRGKTTIARAIAEELGCRGYSLEEIGGDVCNKTWVQDLKSRIRYTPIEGRWRVFIINEAHAMTADAVQAWLTLLEDWLPRRLAIFTTTERTVDMFGRFTGPFVDRAIGFALDQDPEEAFAAFAHFVADAEGLNGAPPEDFRRLIRDCRGSLRAALQRIQKGEMRASSFTPAPARSSSDEKREWVEVKRADVAAALWSRARLAGAPKGATCAKAMRFLRPKAR